MEPDPVRVLLSTYLFQDLSPAELEPLAKTLNARNYRRGEFVFHVGDPADFLHIVATGQVKYFMTTAAGDEFVHEVLAPGAVFGEPGLFAAERNRVVDAMAMQPSIVMSIRRDRLIDFMQRHRPAMMRMLEGLAGDSRVAVETITDLGYAAIRSRVTRKLVDLATTHGRAREDGSVEIALAVSQTILAGLVGATRENVNRAVVALTADGDVRMVGGRFVIADLDALRARADRGWPLLQRRNLSLEDHLGD